MSSDFEIKTEKTAHGEAVTIKQLTGISWDPMYGGYNSPVELTPFEADKLADEIRKAAQTARTNIQKSKYNIP